MLTRLRPVCSGASRYMLLERFALLMLGAAIALGLRGAAAAADPELPAPDASKTHDSQAKVKTLTLAMHEYHDRHQHFPPAVVMGPDGKTPHSWRVELLPLLGGELERLYAQYKLDQPWDSPANKKVLEQMPEIFRSAYDDPKSTNSAFYVLVGPGTIFEGSKGIEMSQITDGTSNTLMIVEAKRNIPWTKPEDIAYDPQKPLPELGGFAKGIFAASMADASGHTFSKKHVEGWLRWLIERNDGHVTEAP
jgi:hypothetical protein